MLALVSSTGCNKLLGTASKNFGMTPEMITNPDPDNFPYLYKKNSPKMPIHGRLFGRTTPGAARKKVEGDNFKHIESLDPRNGLVYIYRPRSTWAEQELQAPSFFIGDEGLFGLPSDSYAWLELHGGVHDFYSKRPLGPFYVKKVFSFPFVVDGGRTYFFRYSEVDDIDLSEFVSNPEDFLKHGPLQQVPESVAMEEITVTKLSDQGVIYGSDAVLTTQWKAYDSFPETGYDVAEVRAEKRQEKARALREAQDIERAKRAEANRILSGEKESWIDRTTGWFKDLF